MLGDGRGVSLHRSVDCLAQRNQGRVISGVVYRDGRPCRQVVDSGGDVGVKVTLELIGPRPVGGVSSRRC